MKYAEYKGTELEWLPYIPAHWEWRFLSQAVKEQKIKKPRDEMYPVLSLSYGNIIRKKNIDEGLVPENYDNYQLVKKGNIILRFTDLQNDHTSLRTGLVKETGIITSAYTCVNPIESPEYIHYLLHSYDTKKVFYGFGGGVRQSIGFLDVRNMMVPVPSREEQDQIVRYLDWQVSKINQLIAAKKKEIMWLDELKKAVVNDAVTHGIEANVPMKYSGVEWLGDIPAHWTTIKLRQILRPFSEKNHPDLPLLSVAREQGVIVRDVEDKDSNHNFIPDDLSGYKLVKKGQFAMNKMKAWQGSYGISNYTGIVSPAYFVFDVDFDNLEYFHYAIRSKVYVNFFAQASDGIRVGQWDLDMDKMKEIPFIVPPTDEQRAIVEYLPIAFEKYDLSISKLKAEIDVLNELKNKLISDVVTGQIDIRGIEIPEYEYTEEMIDDVTDDADISPEVDEDD